MDKINKRILVVDDDPDILDAMKLTLETNGYKVDIFEKGEGLSDKLIHSNFYPDLIILDVFLSGTNGKEVCRQLKDNIKTKHIPVLMVSAHPDLSRSIQDINASGFLAKPFEVHDLLKKVNENVSTK
ncbi:MAG TPA: response regulator [Candidatus Saccharimonadales bacterium]|nr:response regulator [Candidatus Saccharimonadales bacterium]